MEGSEDIREGEKERKKESEEDTSIGYLLHIPPTRDPNDPATHIVPMTRNQTRYL